MIKLLVPLGVGVGVAIFTIAVNAKLKQLDDIRTMYADLLKSHANFSHSFSRMQNFCDQYANAKSAGNMNAALDIQRDPEYLDTLSKLNAEYTSVAYSLYKIRLADANTMRVQLAERYYRQIGSPILLCYNLAGVWDSFKKIDNEVNAITMSLAASLAEDRPTKRFLFD